MVPNPFRRLKDPFTGATYQTVTLRFMTIVAKLWLGSSNENNSIVGNHHNMRDCISVAALERLRTTREERASLQSRWSSVPAGRLKKVASEDSRGDGNS